MLSSGFVSLPLASVSQQSGLWLLGVLLAAIFIVPLMARRIGLPVVVAEILFGVCMGDSGLKAIGNPEWLSSMSELGLIFLMFIAGLEIDMKEILSKHRQDAAVALLIYVLSLALGLLAMEILGYPQFLALIVSATGVGVVIPVIREMGHGDTRFGKMILLASLISEFATLLIVVVFEVIHTHGINARLLNVVYVGLFFYVTLTVLRALIWWFPEKFQILFAEHDPSETGMRFSLFLVALFVGVSMALGLEHVVGSFLAGITLGALFPSRQVLNSKFLGIGFGFFIPIFFIFVGLRFQLPDLTDWNILKPFLLLLVASYVVRALASSILLFVGFGPRETVAGGLLVAAQLSLNIVAGTIALNAGIIDQGLYDSVIMLAVVTSFLFPTIAKWILSRRSATERPRAMIVDDGIDLDTIAQWSPYEESARDHGSEFGS